MDKNRHSDVINGGGVSGLTEEDENMDEVVQNENKRGVVRTHPGSDSEETDLNPKRQQQMRLEGKNEENPGKDSGLKKTTTTSPKENSPVIVSTNISHNSRTQESNGQLVGEQNMKGSTEQLGNPHTGETQPWNVMHHTNRSQPNTNRDNNNTNNDQVAEGGLIIMELIDKSRDSKVIQDRDTLK